jgi:hypothetical protein
MAMAAPERLAIAGRRTLHQPATRPPRSRRAVMDWNDVRVFLAVAREGSMRAAGRALGLSQPTIARQRTPRTRPNGGPRLFDRLPEGLRWIIVHRDLRRAACVRAVIDWMKALFAAERDALAGTA